MWDELWARGEMVWNWHLAEARALRNTLIMLVVFLYTLMLLAMLLGPDIRINVLLTLILFSDVFGFILAIRRFIIGTEVTLIIQGVAVPTAAQRYIELAATALAFTAALGILALTFPPNMGGKIIPALVAMHAITGLVWYFIWRKGPGWIPKITGLVLGTTLVICLIMIYVPYYVPHVFPELYQATKDADLIAKVDKSVTNWAYGKGGYTPIPILSSIACKSIWAYIGIVMVGGFLFNYGKDGAPLLKKVGQGVMLAGAFFILIRWMGVDMCVVSASSTVSGSSGMLAKQVERERALCHGSSILNRSIAINIAGPNWTEVENDLGYLDKQMGEACSVVVAWIPYIPEHLPQERWITVSPKLYLPKGCSLVAGPFRDESPRFFWQNDRRIDLYQFKAGLPFRLDSWDGKGVKPVSVSVNCS